MMAARLVGFETQFVHPDLARLLRGSLGPPIYFSSGVITVYALGTAVSFSFTLAGFHISVAGSRMLTFFPGAGSGSSYGTVFEVPASSVAWGQLPDLRCPLGWFSGGCLGLVNQKEAQWVVADCDQQMWFLGK